MNKALCPSLDRPTQPPLPTEYKIIQPHTLVETTEKPHYTKSHPHSLTFM